MNTRRIVVLIAAAAAAGLAALIVRGWLGGSTPKADAHPAPQAVAMTNVLVAVQDLQPGIPLSTSDVRWQKWPSSSVDPQFITGTDMVSLDSAIAGTVVRSPIVAGEPITFAKIVKSDAAGFMAATLKSGMRAVSIPVTLASVAGGFILPNDRVDIILTESVGDNTKIVRSSIVLSDVRVLAIDQATGDKNQKSVSDVKTATLELSPEQAETVARAQAVGSLSLALRALGDNSAVQTTSAQNAKLDTTSDGSAKDSPVLIIRYGVFHKPSSGGR
jgi:pilus assembly protein CpaB